MTAVAVAAPRAFGKNLVILADEFSTKTEGGVDLPDTMIDEKPTKGVIVSRGAKVDEELQTGMRVVCTKYLVNEYTHDDGKEYLIFPEDGILAIL